jgi:hypothetical protein
MAIYRETGVKNRTQAAMRAEQLLPQLTPYGDLKVTMDNRQTCRQPKSYTTFD